MSNAATAASPQIERHTLAILVANEPGALARVIGLFSGRGYNIESLTVAEVDRGRGLSRITLVTSGTSMIIEQIKAQLERVIPIHRVRDLTEEGPFVARELALIKVASDGTKRGDILRISESFGARIIDSTETSFVFEVTNSSEKVDQFIGLLTQQGRVELARTGIVALSRGAAEI